MASVVITRARGQSIVLSRDFSQRDNPVDNTRSIADIITSNSISIREPLDASRTIPQKLVQLPTQLPEIFTPLTPLGPALQSNSITDIPKPAPTLLTIPLEIRLHIYSYVLHSHPIRHAHLSPVPAALPLTTEELQHTTFSPLKGTNPGIDLGNPCAPPTTQSVFTTLVSPLPGTTSNALAGIKSHPPTLHSIIQGKIPTGLLASCSQIHRETRLIPFQTNTFVFVNWFWSGIYASRQFSKGLKDWQCDAIRWTSVEVLGRDLWESGDMFTWAVGGTEVAKEFGEWRDLCTLWKGVWGLRMCIKGSVIMGGTKAIDGTSISNPSKSDCEEKMLLSTELEWVQHGLAKLQSLRWIELEIEDEDVDRQVKLEFCRELGVLLNKKSVRGDSWDGDVAVVFLERIEVEVEEEPFQWFGGQPGDERVL